MPRETLGRFSVAGLIKTYALMREIRPAGRPTKTVRDSQIPQQEWARIVASDNIMAALNGGTVQLDGSKLLGGATDNPDSRYKFLRSVADQDRKLL